MASVNLAALGRIAGVSEAARCAPDGTLLESTRANSTLGVVANRLAQSLYALHTGDTAASGRMHVTIEYENGCLYCLRTAEGLLLVHAAADANYDVIRLKMTETAEDKEE